MPWTCKEIMNVAGSAEKEDSLLMSTILRGSKGLRVRKSDEGTVLKEISTCLKAIWKDRPAVLARAFISTEQNEEQTGAAAVAEA